MHMQRIGYRAAVIVLLVLSCAISANAAPKYAAKVNGVKIKSITLNAAVDNFIENQKMMGMQVREENEERLRKDILEELISAELLYQESKKAGIGDLSKVAEEQYEGIKKGFASEDEFMKVLKDRGVTEKDLKNDVKKGVYIKTFLDENVYNNISVSEEEKRQEYEKNKDRLNVPEQVRASHILIRVTQDASDEDKKGAREKIEGLRKIALSGQDFAELAKENSEDGSAPNGGELGYFGRGAMVKPFEEAAFSLEIGEISNVVETQFGYHILKVTDRQAARTLSYEEVERDVEKFLLDQRRGEVLEKFVAGLRGKAKIEIY